MAVPGDHLPKRGGRPPPIAWTFPAESASVPSARRVAGGWLAAAGAAEPVTQDVQLVVSELVTNAVQASPPEDEIRVELSAGPLGWGVAVSDRGTGFVLPGGASPSPLAVSGRGLRLVSEIAGPLSIEQDRGWTTVRAMVVGASAGDRITSAGSGRSGP